jgi:hypothetical protein
MTEESPNSGTPERATSRPAVAPPLEPLPDDGVVTVAIGTVLWLVALLVLLPFWHRLDSHGHLWWIAACAWGTGLGLLGIGYCWRRARRLGLR